MDTRGRTLCLITTLVCIVNGTASWGQQTYNPTASDPATQNTAGGTGALLSDRGLNNTAFGRLALGGNKAGNANVAFGAGSLQANISGKFNVAMGNATLRFNTTGDGSVAIGHAALRENKTGGGSVAVGINALRDNTTGSRSVAVGGHALANNTTGIDSIALGFEALNDNTTGNLSVGIGSFALTNIATGTGNVAVGPYAGIGLLEGDNNIYLGNMAPVSTESHTLRLGQTQTRAFIAGVVGVPVSGSQVLINAQGQLGILASSARYKRDVEDMRERSAGVHKLRPVTFRYKTDHENRRQYGLIAEEVDKVYPELVVKGADGKVESVQYHELIPMLLNEVQHQQLKLDAQAQQLTTQGQQLAELKAQNARLEAAVGQQHAAFAARLEQLEQGAHRVTTVSTR